MKHEWVRKFGQDKLKTIFLYINLLYPFFVIGVLTLVNSQFFFAYDGIAQANRCLGKSELVSSIDSNMSAFKMHDFCRITKPLHTYSFEYVIYISKTSICWIHITFFYCNMFNFTEGFLYYRIFSFMRR